MTPFVARIRSTLQTDFNAAVGPARSIPLEGDAIGQGRPFPTAVGGGCGKPPKRPAWAVTEYRAGMKGPPLGFVCFSTWSKKSLVIPITRSST